MMRAVFVLSFVAALAGCSTMAKMNPVNWFSSTPKVNPAELEAISPSATLAALWQANVGGAGGYVLTPAVVGSSVYAAAQDGNSYELNPDERAWTANWFQLYSEYYQNRFKPDFGKMTGSDDDDDDDQ